MPLYVNAMVCMSIFLASFNVWMEAKIFLVWKLPKNTFSNKTNNFYKEREKKKNGHINNFFFALRQDQHCLLHSIVSATCQKKGISLAKFMHRSHKSNVTKDEWHFLFVVVFTVGFSKCGKRWVTFSVCSSIHCWVFKMWSFLGNPLQRCSHL